MKKFITIAALAVVGFAGVAKLDAAIITSVGSIANGDLLLGFDVASSGIGTQRNLLIDLGQYSTLASLGSVNLSADLTTVYGSANPAGLKYGVIGVTDSPQNTTYITTPTLNFIYPKLSASSTVALQGNYLQPLDPGAVNTGTLGYDLANAFQTTANGGYISSSDVNSWTTQNPSTVPFGFYSGNSIQTTLGSALNYLDIMPPTTSGTAGSQVGYFNISSSGILTYTAVPEPSAYALLAMGSLILFVVNRRRSASMKAR